MKNRSFFSLFLLNPSPLALPVGAGGSWGVSEHRGLNMWIVNDQFVLAACTIAV